MSRTCRWIVLAVTVVVGLAGIAPPVAPAAPAEGLPLEDPVDPLVPVRPRSDDQSDRVAALALYSAARSAEQKENFPLALRLYERAYRHDPSSLEVLREIVPLAFRLNRQAEGIRYALIRMQRDDSDPELMRRLALYQAQEGELDKGIALYERVLKLRDNIEGMAARVEVALEAGRLFYLAKKFDRAASALHEVVKALEKPSEHGLSEADAKRLLGEAHLTYTLFGEVFLEAGQFTEAAAAFEKANVAKANPGALAFNQARVAARQKQWNAALEKLQAFFDARQSGEGMAPYELLAEVLKGAEQADQLLPRLEKLREGDKDNLALSYFLAKQYVAAGKHDLAEPVFAAMIAGNSRRPPIEAYQGLLEIALKNKQPEKLLDVLAQAVEKTGTLATLGEAAQTLVADEATVKTLYELARQRQKAAPDATSVGQNLAVGLVALKAKQWDVAREFFELALAKDPKRAPEVILGWGLDLLLAERYADAVLVLKRGIDEKLVPETNAALHYFLAGAHEMNGQTEEALTAARRAAELQKDSPRNASRVAWILYHAKRYDDAKKAYQALLLEYDSKQEPGDVREVLRDARMVLSNIAVVQNDLAGAEEWIEQVLDEFPEDIGAMNDLGYLWADQNKHLNRALPMVRRAVEAEPKNAAYRDSLGWALYRVGQFAEAVKELKLAAEEKDADGVVLDHLGDAQLKAGDRAAAIESWQRAIQAFQRDMEAAKVKPVQDKIDKERAAETK